MFLGNRCNGLYNEYAVSCLVVINSCLVVYVLFCGGFYVMFSCVLKCVFVMCDIVKIVYY